jgi:hypothetical protein
MTTSTRLRTEDILEILDEKIKASAAHAQLGVSAGESYDSVLTRIAARSPTLDEKAALDNASGPSALNPFVTESEMALTLSGSIPWRTIGLPGSGADFEGADETPFLAAFATGGAWFYVMPGTYNFSLPVAVPPGTRLAGGLASATVLASSAGTALAAGDDTAICFLTILTSAPASAALSVSATSGAEVRGCIIASVSDGTTVDAAGAAGFRLEDSALFLGTMSGAGLSHSYLSGLYIDASGVKGLDLDSPDDVVVQGSVFYAGEPRIVSGTNVRIVGNHFNSGFENSTPAGDVLLRANTPSSVNNEDESLTFLLQYLGSPSSSQALPSYSSNFAGPQGEDLTARASALDLCLQWIYEERNFSLVAETEPLVVSWDPLSFALSTTGAMLVKSAHREASWKLAPVAASVPDGFCLYYALDRTLDAVDISLAPQVAALGSLSLETNPPGSAENRQTYVLACNMGGTLWWRGGGGSRFPSGQAAEYFVDGTSKSLLDYLGSEGYDDSDPSYSSNFAGVQGESLTARLAKTDTLIKRLFEHSNLGWAISPGGALYIDGDLLTLSGTLTFRLPHAPGEITVSAQSWASFVSGSLLYFTWDQVAMGPASATVTAGTIPLPDAYPPSTKHFAAAYRDGSIVYLWDGTRLAADGGRWPLPSFGRSVVPTGPAPVLDAAYGSTTGNMVWTESGGYRHFLWESLSVMTSTGISLARNVLADRTSPAVASRLEDGEGLVVTHTWNPGSEPRNATVTKTALPLTFILEQNQFLWVQNRGGYLMFTGDTQ